VFAGATRINKVQITIDGERWVKNVTDSCVCYTSLDKASISGTIEATGDIKDLQWEFRDSKAGKIVKSGSGPNILSFDLTANIVYELHVWSPSKNVQYQLQN
jgi:hypothetical protein